MRNDGIEVLGTQAQQGDGAPAVILGAGERALATEVDRQVATAKAYPRNVTKSLRQAKDMACITPAVAASCYYHLKRKGKGGNSTIIEGPSIRVAEIIMSTWGNIRAQAMVIEEAERHIVARGVAWDMETNVAASVDVRRNIWGNYGRYSQDMIGVTAQAAVSIALRNALLRVVPRVYVDQLVTEAKKVAVGDAKSLASRWQDCAKVYAAMGVPESDLCGYLGITGAEQVATAHLEQLLGLYTALRDGEITIEDAFAQPADPEPSEPTDPAAAMKEKLRAQAGTHPTEPEPPAQDADEWTRRWAATCTEYGASDADVAKALKDAMLKGAPETEHDYNAAVAALEAQLGM
jgi:hypothetical protein